MSCVPGWKPCTPLKQHWSVAFFPCTVVDTFAQYEHYKTGIEFVCDQTLSQTLLFLTTLGGHRKKCFLYLSITTILPVTCTHTFSLLASCKFVLQEDFLLFQIILSIYLSLIIYTKALAVSTQLEYFSLGWGLEVFFTIVLPDCLAMSIPALKTSLWEAREAWHISSSACLQSTQTTPRQQV